LTSNESAVLAGQVASSGVVRARRTPLRRMAIVLGLIVYSLLFGEGFVRVFDAQPLMPRYITGTKWGVRGNIPGARYWHHTPEVDVEYRVNSQGMRADRDFPSVKPPGTCRIELFGDSLFFGYEVDLQNSFAGQLEQRFKDQGVRAEVLNFSVSGFGTAEMLQTYESYGRTFSPDVALFSWDVTDVDDNVRSQLYRLDQGQLQRANLTYLPGVELEDRLMRYRLYRFLSDHSQLYSAIRESSNRVIKALVLQFRRASINSKQAANDVSADGNPRVAARALSSAIVLHSHDVVTADGHDFYLVEIPARMTRTEFIPMLDRLSPEVPKHVKVVSALNELSQAARPDMKLFYERGQGHLTPVGIRILVDRTYAALTSSPQLAACAASGSSAAPTP
jgi:hypothetical protein